MKILVGLITLIVIWLSFLTLWFCELSLENQKQDEALTKIRNFVTSLQTMMGDKAMTKDIIDYTPILRKNNDIAETLDSALKDAFQHQVQESRDNDLDYEYEETNLMWRRTKIHKKFDPFTTYTGRQTQAYISRNLGSSSEIDGTNQNNNMENLQRRNTVQNKFVDLNSILEYDDDHNTITTCILLGDDNINIDDPEGNTTYFNLTMKLTTDAFSSEISFKLLQYDNKKLVINSANDVNLSLNTLHEFEYKCFISDLDQNREKEKEICYDFRLYNPNRLFGGQCCEKGMGFFKMSVNKSPISFGTNRLYGKEFSSSICINSEDGKLIKKEINKNTNLLYPSRECKNRNCICDTNPVIFSSLEHDDMYDIKMNVLTKMILLSGSENLNDVVSSQYKATCWVLLDDPYEYSKQKEAALEKKIEERMIRRYILAMFYFATRPEGWTLHYHFLSRKSECEWNLMEDFYDGELDYLFGCLCDDDENIISISTRK